MTRTQKLTDLQLVLLSTASQRSDGNLLPPPDTLKDRVAAIRSVIASLIKRGLAEEREVTDQNRVWRTDGDLRIGVAITAAGRAALGLEEADAPIVLIGAQIEPATTPSTFRPGSKQALIVSLLQREEGATLDELVNATGWLPHTARAALTGLRKKGQTVVKGKREDVTTYSIAAA